MISDTLKTFTDLLRGSAPSRQVSMQKLAPQGMEDTVPFQADGEQAPLRWSIQLLAQIEWARFEAVMECFFQQAGLMTRARSHGPEEGLDINLYSRHQPGQAVSVARCRQAPAGMTLGAEDVAALAETMAAQGASHAQWVCGGTLSLTDDARKLLRQSRIQCLDAEAVLRLIAGRTEAERQTLLAVALQGEYWRPTCPGCGFKMAQRAHGAEGGRLWACASRHACQHTLAF